MRVIARFSVDGENDGSLRNKLKRRLSKAGFKLQLRTATYEHRTIDAAGLALALQDFWDTADQHAVKGGPGRVDHFWFYSDRKPAPKISK